MRKRRVLAGVLCVVACCCLLLSAFGLFRVVGLDNVQTERGQHTLVTSFSFNVSDWQILSVNGGFFVVGIALLVIAVLAFTRKGGAD